MPESNDTPDGWSEAAAAKQSEALQGLRLQIDGAEIGHGYGTLKGTGRSENFMPDGTQMLLGQGA